MNRLISDGIIIGLIMVGMLSGCSIQASKGNQSASLEWATTTQTNTDLFEHANKPRVFQFPQDHGAHPDFQTEWWYYTGNLRSTDGRAFGYQLTFFRRALLPQGELAARSSDLAINQVYMAHFTLTDVSSNQFHSFQLLDRGDGKIAGATTDPFLHVWLDNWQVNQVSDGQFQLQAIQDGIQIVLTLNDEHGIVLQGDQGLSNKSGNTASYYYSMPRLATTGKVQIDQKEYLVTGSSWMDHEFSTSTLAADQVGWDWFALHLDDGKDIMVYSIRRDDGSIDPYSQGSLIQQDQPTMNLSLEQFNISPLGTWKSPHSGAMYPSGWKLTIPSGQIDLMIVPLIKDQELNLAFTYWEGAVGIEGTVDGKQVTGNGYVELTGYANSMNGQF